MADEKPVDPEVADLQRRLAECEAEKERRRLENRGLRGVLRRVLKLILGERVRKSDFEDSDPNWPPPLNPKEPPQ